MNADDYESLPTTSITINMTAGAIAGVMEHIIMYPMDSVKTRMQSFLPAASGYDISTTFRNMIKKEGLMRPIRGVTAVVAGAGPAHALYFGSYEMTKELLTKFTKNNTFNYMASGATATLIHDAISIPTDVIKQRMQMYNSPYRSVIACVRNVYRTEGITAFYRSYSTQMVMNVPYTALQTSTYEFVQNQLNHERKYNPPVHVLAGGCAGAVAAAVTTPLDVVKTLLNTQETGLTKGMLDAIKKIHKMAGPRGFFKGLGARVLYSMPAVAICWSTYESFRFYLSGVSRESYKSSVTGKNSLKPRDPVSFVPDGTIVQAMEEFEAEDAYVLPNPNETDSTEAKAEKTSLTAPAVQTPGAIKTVCDFSNSVTAPPLSLHTRHTETKTPFDRSFGRP